jgi:ATP-dependent RNA helicase DDX49/DBP8
VPTNTSSPHPNPDPIPPQYDVELVHAIEGLIGQELSPHDMPEDEVLQGITRVYAARKRAALDAIELERRDGGGRRRPAGAGGGGKRAKAGA